MHGYYGLDPKTIDNCCEIKSSWKHRGAGSGTKDKRVCGQFEGSCNNQDECQSGYTCNTYLNSSKLEKFMYLSKLYSNGI